MNIIQNEQILTERVIEKAFNKTLNKIEQEKEQRQLQNINKEKEQKELAIKYKKESSGNFGGIEIDKNKITLSPTLRYILKRKVNEIFDCDFFNETYFFGGRNFDRIECALIEGQESYVKQEEDKGNWHYFCNLIYKIPTDEDWVIGCSASAGDQVSPTLPSQEFGLEDAQSSNLIYWIIGIAVILIVIVFLIMRKKH